MITSVQPMSVEHARALATAYQLQTLLSELTERGEHFDVESVLSLMERVVEHLEPAAFFDSPSPLVRIVHRRALHALATKRWRP
jgi:hypothetical protein